MYFHEPDDTNWNYNSYVRIGDMSTVEDFWDFNAAIAKYLSRGMFFVMREHVYPCWDDKHNIDGGCLSMKVLKEDMPAFWEHLMVRMLGEALFAPPPKGGGGGRGGRGPAVAEDAWSIVNGISVSPKRYFCIVKLWLRTEDFTHKRFFALPAHYNGEVLYKNNTDNIKNNNYVVMRDTAPTSEPPTPPEAPRDEAPPAEKAI